MITFLKDAYLVLLNRAERIVKILADQPHEPPAVVERCRRVAQHSRQVIDEINDKILFIEAVNINLENHKIYNSDANRLLKKVLLAYRDHRRTIDGIEENFVGHIVRYNKSDLFFTNLAEVLWEETNLPDMPPIAVTSTSDYFCTLAPLGIIFSPPSTEYNLLIIPDLYHEFGHIVHETNKLFGTRFNTELKAHIEHITNQVRRHSRPILQQTIDDITEVWIRRWAEEVACDTLATMIIGPAYGWCNLQLCLQNSNAFSSTGAHPADAARTDHILKILRRQGYSSEADKIKHIWDQYIEITQQTLTGNYQDYHPQSLFTAIMEDVEAEISRNGFFGIKDDCQTIKMLNEAWALFNQDNQKYRDWELRTIETLKIALKIPSAI